MATATALSIGLALLVLALLATTAGSRNSGNRAARANGGAASVFIAALAYVIVVAPVVIPYGLVLATTLLLIVVVALPAIGAGLAVGVRDRLGTNARDVYDWAGVVVSVALLAGLLATAGSVLSLMGGVNRILVTVVIGVAGAGYLLARGRESASRTSRWAAGFAFAIPVLLLLLGAVVSKPTVIVDSLVPYEALPLASAAAIIIAVAVCTFLDPALGLVLRGSTKPGKSALWGAIIAGGFILIFGLALILVFGGAFVSPTLQAFLLAAAPPVVVGFFLFFAVFVLTSASDTQLAAGTEVVAARMSPAKRRPTMGVIVLIAVVLAVVLPSPGQIFALAAIVAAAASGAVLPAVTGKQPELTASLSVAIGLVGAIVVAIVAGPATALTFGAPTVVCLIVSFVLATVSSLVLGARKSATAPANA